MKGTGREDPREQAVRCRSFSPAATFSIGSVESNPAMGSANEARTFPSAATTMPPWSLSTSLMAMNMSRSLALAQIMLWAS